MATEGVVLPSVQCKVRKSSDSVTGLTFYSAVLRDAQSCNGDNSNKEIHFVDMDFENRDILRLFLHLLTQPAVPFPTKDRLTHCLSLTNFLKKYDCGQGLQVLRLCVLAAFTAHGDRWEYVDAFVVGAALDDPLLCSTALQREEKARLRYGQPHFGIRDIPVVPLDFIPQHYLSALAKSVPGCGLYCECDSKEGSKHTAQEFPLILEVVKRDLQAARSKRRQAGTSNSASTGKKKRTCS